MERLSDRAIDIVNELHRERLDYNSEYAPLIDALQKLSAYEDCGIEPEYINGDDCISRKKAMEHIEKFYADPSHMWTMFGRGQLLMFLERMPSVKTR